MARGAECSGVFEEEPELFGRLSPPGSCTYARDRDCLCSLELGESMNAPTYSKDRVGGLCNSGAASWSTCRRSSLMATTIEALSGAWAYF